jgi:quercetin dioxygenase-like cupin family protein
MRNFDRRSTVVLGLATTTAALAAPQAAAQTTYSPNDGREVVPGVRRVDLSRRQSAIPAYKTVSMRDMVYQPGAGGTRPSMPNDMVCHCLEGELEVDLGPGMQFTAKKGDVWTCAKGMPESASNKGSAVAIMRVTDLLT